MAQLDSVRDICQSKISREARRSDRDLRRIIGHMSILDSLDEEVTRRRRERLVSQTRVQPLKPVEKACSCQVPALDYDCNDDDDDDDDEEEDDQFIEDLDDDFGSTLIRVISHPPDDKQQPPPYEQKPPLGKGMPPPYDYSTVCPGLDGSNSTVVEIVECPAD